MLHLINATRDPTKIGCCAKIYVHIHVHAKSLLIAHPLVTPRANAMRVRMCEYPNTRTRTCSLIHNIHVQL